MALTNVATGTNVWMNTNSGSATGQTITKLNTYSATTTGLMTQVNSHLQAWSNQLISTNTSTSAASSINEEMVTWWLKNRGIRLDDGGKLVFRDGELVVEYRHTDGDKSDYKVPLGNTGAIDLQQRLVEILPGTALRLPNGEIIEITKEGKVLQEIFVNAHPKIIDVVGGNTTLYESLAFCHFNEIHIPDGVRTTATLVLPNKTKIKIFPDDHIEIDDTDERRLYQSQPVRDFNKYLNASDLLESFIEFCAKENMTKKEFSELPISLFILWLIVRAGETDGDPVDETLPMLTHAVRVTKSHTHRCKCCGKFLTRKYEENQISFCSPEHMSVYLEKVSL